MSTTFVFPDRLHDLTLDRLGIDTDSVTGFKAQLPRDVFTGRIGDITLKVKGDSWDMRFCLDGRKSGKCVIDRTMQAWVDAGLVSLDELAVHFCTTIKPGFGRQPVQKTLFP